MSLPNPEAVVTEQRLNEFYNGIYPYLGGNTGGTPKILYSSKTTDTISQISAAMKSILDALTPIERLSIAFVINNQRPYMFQSLNDSGLYGFSCAQIPINGANTIKYVCVGGTNLEYDVYTLNRANNDVSYTHVEAQGSTLASGNNFKLVNIASVNPSLDYSTDEKVVGTWIDGKTIYQRTFTGITPSTSRTNLELTTEGNYKAVIDYNGYIEANYGNVNIKFWDTVSGKSYGCTGAKVLDSTHQIVFSVIDADANSYLNKNFFITVQYTKTTS